MKNYLLLISILISAFAFAQPAAVHKADAAFESGKYYEAADLSVKAYEKISPKNPRALAMKSELAYKAAYSFEKAYDLEKSIDWYNRAIDLKHFEQNPYVYFRLGSAYKVKGEYDKAKKRFEEFLILVPSDKQALNALASLEDAVVMKDNRTRYTVKSELKINTAGLEMAPIISNRRGTAVAFASTRQSSVASGKDPITGEGYFNIWQAELDRSGNWSEPKLFEADSLNTEFSEGSIAMDGRFRTIYVTRCPSEFKKNFGCQIWTAEKKGRGFGIPTKVILGVNDSISVGHPLPNENGSILIFSSDMPGGEGGRDLWYSEFQRRENSWTTPTNLGPEINTKGDELFPTYALNGDLLFASDGHKGLGGLDIYVAPKEEEMKFGKPENLGTPINSDANDYHMTEVTERFGYFTSNRKGSKGTRSLPDVWSYELPPNIFDLKVIVAEIGGSSRVDGAIVEVTEVPFEVEEGEEAPEPIVFKGTTNATGEIFWDKQPDGKRFINEARDYSITILSLEGYHESDNVEEFSTIGLAYDQNFILEMSLLPKTPIVLPEVRYALGSDKLQTIEGVINSKDSLNYVFELLEEYPGMVLRLVSHSDSRGRASSNESLAKRRAQSCVDYLVNEKGVNLDRLVPIGKGESTPRIVYSQNDEYFANKPSGEFAAIELTETYINQFKTTNKELFEKLHQFNRRTEGKVMRMDYIVEQDIIEEEFERVPESEEE